MRKGIRSLVSGLSRMPVLAALCAAVALPAAGQTGSARLNLEPAGPAVSATAAGQPLAGTSAGGFSAGRTAVPSAIAADYAIGANDLLEIEVFGVDELKRTVRVNSSGQVSLPLIGAVAVAGLTSADAQALIARAYEKDYLRDPQVSIFIKEFTSQRITIDGAVARPGIYPLVGQVTLLRALAMAGGGGQLADLENVVLFRPGANGQSIAERYDVDKIRLGEVPDPVMQGDDILVVNRSGARVTLRDSLFSDILGTLNPFSSIYRNSVSP